MNKLVILFLITVMVGGCSTYAQKSNSSLQPHKYQPQSVNLSGFPPAYKVGYQDGCESVDRSEMKKDIKRFKTDSQYASGWRDGYDLCKKR
ncbi:hypothetical protein EDC63_101423 [Sulfurirhabdus autotrophica]|uniref:Lipoprotein n=2 Tax=Sulfurirhabdus autotrophica TaxID=1706046 RepID=A0A4R3YEF6_9PROT|nr:hypothetical protein EDC63_101423 [Sulfurirhabdus autotrophica]